MGDNEICENTRKPSSIENGYRRWINKRKMRQEIWKKKEWIQSQWRSQNQKKRWKFIYRPNIKWLNLKQKI